jgi:hypothetical protein
VSLFHHERQDTEHPEDAASFDVLGGDGIRRYARAEFDEIFATTDAEEAQRQVDIGWVILDEREVEGPEREPSAEDLIPGIQGLRVGGLLGYEQSASVTRYVLGYLKDGAQGDPAE